MTNSDEVGFLRQIQGKILEEIVTPQLPRQMYRGSPFKDGFNGVQNIPALFQQKSRIFFLNLPSRYSGIGSVPYR